jgi:hypothetical protein
MQSVDHCKTDDLPIILKETGTSMIYKNGLKPNINYGTNSIGKSVRENIWRRKLCPNQKMR